MGCGTEGGLGRGLEKIEIKCQTFNVLSTELLGAKYLWKFMSLECMFIPKLKLFKPFFSPSFKDPKWLLIYTNYIM